MPNTCDHSQTVAGRTQNWWRATLTAALLLGLLSLTAAQAPDDNPLSVTLAQFMVSEVAADDGTVDEVFSAADQVHPGDTLEYRLHVENISDTPLAAQTVKLLGPVPEGTFYVADSATPSSSLFRVEVSADGDIFGVAPLFITVTGEDGVEEQVEVDPSEYVAVRWVLLNPFTAGESYEFSYRVVVR